MSISALLSEIVALGFYRQTNCAIRHFFCTNAGVMGHSPLPTLDARRSAILSLRTSSHWVRAGQTSWMSCDPLPPKRQSGNLPIGVLLSVAFRLLYHGSYECGESRRNHGYRGSVGSFCEERRARWIQGHADICSENCI